MKASEVRIGNLVELTFDNETEIVDVKVIDLVQNYVRLAKPIPLTEEWLIKFGFVKKPDIDNVTYYTIVFEKDGISLLFFMGGFDDCSINGDLEIDLSYVHDLQNFWMCLKKEELTIKNK